MKSDMKMDDCCDHASQFAPKVHPDGARYGKKDPVGDHARGAAHPKHHTSGKMRSQMQPDHGPHK